MPVLQVPCPCIPSWYILAFLRGICSVLQDILLDDIPFPSLSPTPHPNKTRPVSFTDAGCPCFSHLLSFESYDVCECLEILVARIDAPYLTFFEITYFNQLGFQFPGLSQFISRAEFLQTAPFERAFVGHRENKADVRLRGET